MSIIDDQMAHEIAKEQAKEQVKCQHIFETRHIELLNEDVEICSKCDINKKLYEFSKLRQCFSQYHWYKIACWTCPLSYLCQAQKELKK